MQQQSNGDDTRSDGAPEPGDASRGWQRTKRWSDSESWHLCRASLWSKWHGLAHGSWLRLALRTGDHCAVDLTSCWIGDPVGFEKEEGLCGTLHGARTRCPHVGLRPRWETTAWGTIAWEATAWETTAWETTAPPPAYSPPPPPPSPCSFGSNVVWDESDATLVPLPRWDWMPVRFRVGLGLVGPDVSVG